MVHTPGGITNAFCLATVLCLSIYTEARIMTGTDGQAYGREDEFRLKPEVI